MLRLVLRSYGGENLKGRPGYYSKELAFTSFERAALHARAVLGATSPADPGPGAGPRCGVSVTFVNDGPVPESLTGRMYRLGDVVPIPNGPVGTQGSYTFALDLPAAMGWPDEDVVVFVEDDYLLAQDAFVAIAQAAEAIPQAGYFALGHGRPRDFSDPEQLRRFGIVPWWRPAPDIGVQGRRWINILGVTSTFAARVGVLRQDRDIFMLCQRPFRKRWYDHETAMLYQGVRPYRGTSFWTGMPDDFTLSVRGVLRAAYLVPFRVAMNLRAGRQRTPHYLYAPDPVVAAHMEVGAVEDPAFWAAEAERVRAWARETSGGIPA